MLFYVAHLLNPNVGNSVTWMFLSWFTLKNEVITCAYSVSCIYVCVTSQEIVLVMLSFVFVAL